MGDSSETPRLDVRVVLQAMRRRWWLTVVCWLAVLGSAIAWTASQEKQYSATAGLLFRDPGLDQKLFGTTYLQPNRDPGREAATNVKLVSLDVVALRTARRLGGLTGEQVAKKVTAEAEGQSDVVSVTATDPDPAFARRIANAFATQYIAFRREADRSKIAEAQTLVQRRLAALSPTEREGAEGRALKIRSDQLEVLASLQTGNAELVQTAQTPRAPSSPDVELNIALGAVLGLLLGAGIAFVMDWLDRRIREPEELETTLGYPILGLVPRSAALAAARVHDPAGAAGLPQPEAEAFRMLRARLRYFNVDRQVRSVLVSSPSAGEGKSTVALYLSAAAATSGARVLLLESDLRRPMLSSRLGESPSAGLAEVLTRSATLLSVMGRFGVMRGGAGSDGGATFDFLPAGFPPPNPSELIESHRMSELLEELTPQYDLVVIDSPPLLVVSDAIPLIRQVDGVLIVCRLGLTTRDAARHLASELEGLNAPVLGIVANGLRARPGPYYYGYQAPGGAADDGLGAGAGEREPAARLHLGRRRR